MLPIERFVRGGPAAALLRSIGLLLLLLGVTACRGETLVEAPSPETVFENDRFRILDMTLPPGTTLEHAPEHGMALMSMSERASVRTRTSDEDWTEATPHSLGSVSLVSAGTSHGVQNVGEVAHQLFGIESLRSSDAAAGDALSTRGVTLAAESPELRAYDVRMDEQTFQVSHVHEVPAVAVLVAGRIISQGAELESGPDADAPTGVKQLDQPGQWVFVPAGETHYVVRLGTDPVHVVEVELR